MYKLLVVLVLALCAAVACSDDDPLAPTATKGTVTIVGTLTDDATDETVTIRLLIEYDAFERSTPREGRRTFLTAPVSISLSGRDDFLQAAVAAIDSSRMNLLYVRVPDQNDEIRGAISGHNGDNRFSLAWFANYRGRLGGGDSVSLDDVLAAQGRMIVSGTMNGVPQQHRGVDMIVSVRGTKALEENMDEETP